MTRRTHAGHPGTNAGPARIAVLTVSDGVAAGTRADASGDLIVQWVGERGYELVERVVESDDTASLGATLLALCDRGDVDLILTTGGTGFTTRDVTPETTRAVIERDAPGIAERIRQAGAGKTPYAALSRGVAGIRGSTLVVNLPGSTGGVRDGLQALEDLVDHAVQLLRGVETHRHDPPHG